MILIASAKELRDADAQAQGAGLIDLDKALKTKKPEKLVQEYRRSTGLGCHGGEPCRWSMPGSDGRDHPSGRWR